jgi:hypothetical protein
MGDRFAAMPTFDQQHSQVLGPISSMILHQANVRRPIEITRSEPPPALTPADLHDVLRI